MMSYCSTWFKLLLLWISGPLVLSWFETGKAWTGWPGNGGLRCITLSANCMFLYQIFVQTNIHVTDSLGAIILKGRYDAHTWTYKMDLKWVLPPTKKHTLNEHVGLYCYPTKVIHCSGKNTFLFWTLLWTLYLKRLSQFDGLKHNFFCSEFCPFDTLFNVQG